METDDSVVIKEAWVKPYLAGGRDILEEQRKIPVEGGPFVGGSRGSGGWASAVTVLSLR